MEILNLRNLESIRMWMTNPEIISEESHFNFVEKLKDNKDRLYFAIFDDGVLVGTYNLTRNEDGSWERGLFANPITQGKGETKRWELNLLSGLPLYGIEVVTAKVKLDNVRSIRYHEKVGYKETFRDNEYIYYVLNINMITNVNRGGYFVNDYKYKDFTSLTLEEKKMVLEWRNTENIRKWMYNKDEIDLESHLKFIDGLNNREDKYYWLVKNSQDESIGVVNVTDIDRVADRAELGLYMKPDSTLMGYFFVRECYYFYFNVLEFKNLYCSVDCNNRSAMLLDQFFGCSFSERKIIEGDRSTNEYLVSTNLTKLEFDKRYNLTFKDYISFVRSYNIKANNN